MHGPDGIASIHALQMHGCCAGWGAVRNTAKVKEGSTVAVFGLGVIGLAVIEVRPAFVPGIPLRWIPSIAACTCLPPFHCQVMAVRAFAVRKYMSHQQRAMSAGGEAGWRTAHLWHRHQPGEVRARKEVGRR